MYFLDFSKLEFREFLSSKVCVSIMLFSCHFGLNIECSLITSQAIYNILSTTSFSEESHRKAFYQ